MIILRRGLSHLSRYVQHKTTNFSTNECTPEKKNSMYRTSECIVWMDMEMTGLDPLKDKILELACLVTDCNLKTVSDEFEIVIHQPDEVLNGMDEWNTKQHRKSGLIDGSRNSKITNSDAELKLLDFLQNYIPQSTCPLAGNSIHMDRMFLKVHLPLVDSYLHYRLIDVSSLKELARRWNRRVYKERPQKQFTHRALDDIKESISELDYYRTFAFQAPDLR
ncbi:oligoribonuclease-like [Leptopilina heterotoma]|uniref:oligoribonuclease-like n=1 Tax=Leptopilina heterotoma TaxID=63436 RepID=UPI001CA8C4A5|nr:oligoribonuclease-like [Leptopilina heterotoma]XP_043477030.1 oligoribonuclease-like [Leptopilina heterotoma]XP_043477037.1 oligoribonuclease-like [Leptopilina heterotoma]XP_043477045.1 oligoribonuclease-like [Leptopilina heterotoma]